MNLVKKISGLVAAALVSLLPFAAQAQTGLQSVIDDGVLRIGVTQSPPWFFRESSDAEWSGVGVNLGSQMAADLGIDVAFVETTWGNAVAALQADQFDLMFILDATPSRATAVDFSLSPSIYYAMAVMGAEDMEITTWEALNTPDVSIAVAQGTAIETFIRRVMPDADIQSFAGNAEAVAAFQSGRTDLVAMFHPALISFRQQLGRGAISLPTPIFASASSVGIRPLGDTTFRDWVTIATAYYYNTGRTQTAYEEALIELGIDPATVPPIQRELWD